MAKKGFDVTVFEALHEIGGVLKYGILRHERLRQLFPSKIIVHFIEYALLAAT